MLSPYLHLVLPSGLFVSGLPVKNSAPFCFLPHTFNIPRPSDLHLFDRDNDDDDDDNNNNNNNQEGHDLLENPYAPTHGK